MMKIAELLKIRAECAKQVNFLDRQLCNNALIQEGDDILDSPEELLKELEIVLEEKKRVTKAINLINAKTELIAGYTISEALTDREVLGKKHGVLSSLILAANVKSNSYSRSEIRFIRTVDVKALRQDLNKIAKELRQLDLLIQEKNWTVEANY